MVCFLALVLEMALRRKLGATTEEALPYDDLLHHLELVKAVVITSTASATLQGRSL